MERGGGEDIRDRANPKEKKREISRYDKLYNLNIRYKKPQL